MSFCICPICLLQFHPFRDCNFFTCVLPVACSAGWEAIMSSDPTSISTSVTVTVPDTKRVAEGDYEQAASLNLAVLLQAKKRDGAEMAEVESLWL